MVSLSTQNTLIPGRSYTGYHVRKIWGEASKFNKTSVRYTDPLMRLTEYT
jgi:hypothetical protein